MNLEDRLAPGNLLGEALALAMPAQVMSLFSLPFEGTDTSAPTLVNAVPNDAPPTIDPGVTLTSWIGPVGETFTSVATATQESAPIAFDPTLNDQLFASPSPILAPISPPSDTPSPSAGAYGGPSASPTASAFSTSSSPPPASSAPTPVVPPPGMNSLTSPPTANNDAYNVSNGTLTVPASGVLANDTNPGGQPMTASIVASASHGIAMLNSDGSFSYNATPGYSGTDTFTYQATAGGLTSNTATVTLTVTAAPPPVANNDAYTVNGGTLSVAASGVMVNDTNPGGQPMTASIVASASHGMAMLNQNGSFTYTATTGYVGSDSFTYRVTAGGLTSNVATVTLTVTAPTPPTANNDAYTLPSNGTLTVPPSGVLTNDSSSTGSPLTAALISSTTHGSVSLNNDGSFIYTPSLNYVGTDSFTYSANDGMLSATATVNLTVHSGNVAPTAGNLNYSVTHDQVLIQDNGSGVLSSAADANGDSLTAVLFTNPTHGTIVLNTDGSFVYTPNTGYVGSDSFTFKAFDGLAYSNTATASLAITNVAPSAMMGIYNVSPSSPTVVNTANGLLTLASDADFDSLTASIVSGPSLGTLSANSDGSFSYVPGSNFLGTDSFTFEVSDGISFSQVATVSLTTAPVAANQYLSLSHDRSLVIAAAVGLLSNVGYGNGGTLSAALAGGPSHGNLVLYTDGSFNYTPTTGYTGTDQFTFTVSAGGQTSSPATVFLTIVNKAPQAINSYYSTAQGTALTQGANTGVLTGASDLDGDAMTAQLVSGPSHGTVTLSPNGAFVYTPQAGYFGIDSFSFQASDGLLLSAVAVASITVNQVVSTSAPGAMPFAAATGDFNGDGTVDVAVTDLALNTVSVYFVSSGGVLASTPISVISVGNAPSAIVSGDFNGDGKADLAVANSGSGTISILLGNGNGGVTIGTTLTGFTSPSALAVADFNGDGKADLAVVNKGANTVSVLLGAGNGTFISVGQLTPGLSPTSVTVADFNGDGKVDLAVAVGGNNGVAVFLGQGMGSFSAMLPLIPVGNAPAAVVAGDFNGDGVVDLAVANSGSGTVTVLLGNGDGSFAASQDYTVGTSPVALAIGDWNGDGLLDISVTNRDSNTLTELSNSGSGAFDVVPQAVPFSHPTSVVSADFNHDGFMDQIVVLSDPGLLQVAGAPDAKTKFVAKMMATTGSELIAAGSSSNLVRVYTTTANAKQTILWEKTFSSSLLTIALFDYNTLSVLAVGLAGGQIRFYNAKTGTSLGSFLNPISPQSLEFSPDGKILVIGNRGYTPNKQIGTVLQINADGTPGNSVGIVDNKWTDGAPVIAITHKDRPLAANAPYVFVTSSARGPEGWVYDPVARTVVRGTAAYIGPNGADATTATSTFDRNALSNYDFYATARSDGVIVMTSTTDAGVVKFVGSPTGKTAIQFLAFDNPYLFAADNNTLTKWLVVTPIGNRNTPSQVGLRANPQVVNVGQAITSVTLCTRNRKDYLAVSLADGSVWLYNRFDLNIPRILLQPANK